MIIVKNYSVIYIYTYISELLYTQILWMVAKSCSSWDKIMEIMKAL